MQDPIRDLYDVRAEIEQIARTAERLLLDRVVTPLAVTVATVEPLRSLAERLPERVGPTTEHSTTVDPVQYWRGLAHECERQLSEMRATIAKDLRTLTAAGWDRLDSVSPMEEAGIGARFLEMVDRLADTIAAGTDTPTAPADPTIGRSAQAGERT